MVELQTMALELQQKIGEHLFLPNGLVQLSHTCHRLRNALLPRIRQQSQLYQSLPKQLDDTPHLSRLSELLKTVLNCPDVGAYVEVLYVTYTPPDSADSGWPDYAYLSPAEKERVKRHEWTSKDSSAVANIQRGPTLDTVPAERFWDLLTVLLQLLPRLRALCITYDEEARSHGQDDISLRVSFPMDMKMLAIKAAELDPSSKVSLPLSQLEVVYVDYVRPKLYCALMSLPSVKVVRLSHQDFIFRLMWVPRSLRPYGPGHPLVDSLPLCKAEMIEIRYSDADLELVKDLVGALQGPCVVLHNMNTAPPPYHARNAWRSVVLHGEVSEQRSYICRTVSWSDIDLTAPYSPEYSRLTRPWLQPTLPNLEEYLQQFRDLLMPLT